MIPKEIKILSLCFFIIFFAYNGVQQFLTAYFSDLDMVKTGFWSLILIYFSLLIANFFSGSIVSKFGVKKCLAFGSLFYSLFTLTLISRTPIFVYLASVFLGIGASILWTAQGTFLIRSSDSRHYGKNSGFFNTFFQIGSVLGILIFSFLVVGFSFKNSFLIFGSLPLVATIILLTLKNVEPKTVDLRNKFQTIKGVITNPMALRFSLIWFSFSLIIASISGQFPLEIKKYFGLSSIGFIAPIFYFLPIISSYYLGKTSDIRGRKLFLILAYILVLSGLGLFMFQVQLGLDKMFFILSFLLISLGYAFFAPLRFALLGDISSDHNLEYLTALSLLANNGGYVIVFLSNMYLPSIFSYLVPFFIVFSSLIIILPVLKLNMKTLKEKINS